ncbi:MAG: PAS domain-containing protein, partial [Candidatus Marinimicrobia bacterium]|nr:PAS domain-containing protein [Candidatus Neomarinimicrobiota bacterium]
YQPTYFPPLYDSITDFFLVCDEKFTIVAANKAAKSVYAAGTGDLVGQKCYAALRGKKSPCAGCPLPETLSSGRVVPVEFYESDLREFLELRTYPYFDNSGNYRGFTLLKRIVSKRREQEDETAQSKKLQALGQMASGVAHDFNNMLTIILGRIQLLKSKVSEQVSFSNLQTMEKAALDSTDIIQRLQDFTRKRYQPESDNFDLLDINLVIEDVVSYASTRIEKLKRQYGIQIAIEQNLEATDKVEGNESQLRSAILNIIFNSIAALEIGGVISIWTRQIGSQIEIGVSDTGVGMTDDIKEKIFDPFFSTKGDEGNGLGLSEVYGIINHHNGSIKVESTVGEGTTMLLYLPSTGRN